MPQYYEIRIKGHLDESWADWFDGLTLTHQANGETILAGPLPDQGALHGLLNRVRDLGIQLISVNPVENTRTTGTEDIDEHS
jgi:hypothetical protein